MLEKYKDKQPLFYEEIKNSIANNKISHAYLIETNGYLDSFDLIISFVKDIFAKYITNEEELENIYNLIDNNIFSDFTIIESDTTVIKKEQILSIREKYMTTSVEDRPRIYLIKDADKLNQHASNSLLKFLEEPEGNIIAILMVDNRYKVLETIRSRCQIYPLLSVNKTHEYENIELIEKIIDHLENYRTKTIAYLPMILENDYRDKLFWIDTFNCMIDIYENSLRKKENIKYNSTSDIIDLIERNNEVDEIIYKINVLFETLNNLEFNLNITMMLDKFIIEFTGGE